MFKKQQIKKQAMLSALDWIIIAIYAITLLAIGYFTSRKQTSEDFLIAKRGLSTWGTMATINASKTGSIIMAFVAMTYIWGFSAMWYFIGVILGALLFIPFSVRVRKNMKKRYYTIGDYFKHNYGKTAGKLVGSISVFLMFGFAIVNIIAGAKIFMYFTAWPFAICATLMSAVILIYLLLGGFKAVAKTDIMQYFAIVFIFVILAILLFQKGAILATDWAMFNVDIATLAGFFIIGVLYPFASADLWQRIYAARGTKELRNGMLISVGFYAIVAFLLGLISLIVRKSFPNIDPDLALIHGFNNLLPTGLVGLATVLLFAAIMSTTDTYMFTGSAAFAQDLCNWKKRKAVKQIRKIILLVTVFGTGLAIAIQSLVIGSYLFASFYAVVGVTSISTWFGKRSKEEVIGGLSLGCIATILFIIISMSQGEITPTIVIVGIASTLIGIFGGKLFMKKKR